jgi:hypothetical protein
MLVPGRPASGKHRLRADRPPPPKPQGDEPVHAQPLRRRPTPSVQGEHDDTFESELDKLRRNLGPPAHIQIATMIAVAAIVVMATAMVFAPD